MNIKYSIRFLLFLWMLAGTACYDDKGNYDYKPVEQTYVREGIDISYQRALGDILEIIPTVVNGGDNLGDTSRYEYWWTAQREITREDEDNTLHVIGHGLSLYYEVDLPKLSHGDKYLLTLHMKDKETGIDWTKTSLLTVTGTFAEGWLLLSDNEGEAELNLYAKKSDGSMQLVKNLLKYSGNPYLRGPRKVVYEKTINVPPKIWILTDAGTSYIDKDDYLWNNTQMMKYMMLESVENDYTCEDIVAITGGVNTVQIMEDGKGVQFRPLLNNGGIYQGNVAMYQDGTRFSVARYFGHGSKSIPIYNSVLLYDTDNKQFVTCGPAVMGGSAEYCTALSPASTWKIGKKMLYMQHANASRTYALFEEEGSDDILQCEINFGMGFSPSGPVPSLTMLGKKTLTGATHLKNARLRIYQAKKGYLYYVDGNTLYTWSDGQEVPLKTFSEEITALHSQITMGSDSEAQSLQAYLLVATYGPQEDVPQNEWGNLYFFTVDESAPEIIREANRVTGVGKVIDIDYQEK